MKRKIVMMLVPAAAVSCLLALGIGPAAAANSGGVTTASGPPHGLAVTAIGNLHGFKLAYEGVNNDGSVTAVWRLKKMAIVYTGGAASRMSVAMSSRTFRLKVKTGKKGHKKTRRVVQTTMQVGASAPASDVATKFRTFGSDRLSATQVITGDLAKSGLSQGAIKTIAAEDAKMTTATAGGTSLAGQSREAAVRPADTSAPDGNFVTSWCINTLYGDAKSAISTGCDVRTKLQQATGNNYIADDMQGKAECQQNDNGSCTGFLAFNIHMDYSFPSDNKVVHLEPLNAYSDGCTEGPSVSFSWFGIGFNYQEETCDNTMNPEGLGSATNVGSYWYGSCGMFTCYGSTPVGVEEVAQDHSTGHLNPDSVLYVNQEWNDYDNGTGDDYGTCPNGGC